MLSFDNSKLVEDVRVEQDTSENTKDKIIVEEGGLTFEPLVYPESTMGKVIIEPLNNRSQKYAQPFQENMSIANGRVSNKKEILRVFNGQYPK